MVGKVGKTKQKKKITNKIDFIFLLKLQNE